MSTKTSHRRRHGVHRRNATRAGVEFANLGHAPVTVDALLSTDKTCRGGCRNQGCDECHDIDNCVTGTERYGDLLLCRSCRDHHPAAQPWRIDPETGDYVDTLTGKVL